MLKTCKDVKESKEELIHYFCVSFGNLSGSTVSIGYGRQLRSAVHSVDKVSPENCSLV